MDLNRAELGPLLERLAERYPGSLVIAERDARGDFAILWANAAAVERLDHLAVRALLDDRNDTTVQLACADAIATDCRLELDLRPSHTLSGCITIIPLGPRRLAIELRRDAKSLDLSIAGELERQRDARFEMLFSQSLNSIFFMTLDEPIRWDAAADQEALLDYAFEHLRVTSFNDATCRQLETPRERLLGTATRDRWSGDPQQWREHMRHLYNQGHVHHSLRAPRGDGTWLDVEGEYICTYDREGRITGHCGIQHDVSMKRAAAVELATSLERLDLAIVGAGIGIWDVDVAARTVVFGQHWLERFGYDTTTARDWDWWRSVIHPDDVAKTQLAFRAHAMGQDPLFRVEYRMRTVTGEWLWVLSTGRVTARDGQGQAVRVVGICVDITERKQLDDRLVASERLVALGTLAAGVGHEINNPLTYVALNLERLGRELEALERSAPAPFTRARDMLDQTRYGTQRVARIVRDLQMLARPWDERVAVVDPNKILERCLQIADHQIRHRARLISELGPVPQVQSSEDRMIQLFLNLIINAVQAIPEGSADRSWIRVASCTAADGRAVVEISDNGVGIAAGDMTRIYDPFFTTKGVGEGTGLGLSICRGIVMAMGGTIDVHSAADRGTLFRVSMPGSPVASRSGASEESRAGVTGLRVLVIDDEPLIGQVLARVLDRCEVVVETSARVAVDRLRAGETFDRILCDLMMPDVGGIDFYDQLAEVAPELRPRVVFVTGGAFTDRSRDFLARVPNRRLDKPFDLDQLAAALGE